MADQVFHFPASGQTYTLPDGRTLYIKIYYDDGGGASNTNTSAEIKKLHPLKIPLEIDPNAQTYRHGEISIEFWNTGDVFEDEAILNNTYKYETFIDIQIDGSLFWRGLIDYDKIQKGKYRFDSSGDLVYDSIKLRCIDALYYFWTHDDDLSDVSYTDDTTDLETLLESIGAEIGFASADVNLDANLTWTEGDGSAYTWDDLIMNGYSDATLVRTFLKELMLGFCCFIYIYNGKLNVILRKLGTTQVIDKDDICENGIKIKENYNPIEYVKFEAGRDWGDITGDPPDAVTYTQTYGSVPQDDSKKFEHVEADEDFLSCIYVARAENRLPTGEGIINATSNTGIDDDYDMHSNDIECGDRFEYNDPTAIDYSVVKYTTYSAPYWHLECEAIGVAIDDSDNYNVLRAPNGRRYKIYQLHNFLKDTYNQFFLTSPDILWLKLRDISTHVDTSKRFTIFSNNHKVRSINCRIAENIVEFDLAQVT